MLTCLCRVDKANFTHRHFVYDFALQCAWLIKTTFVFKHYLGTMVGRKMDLKDVPKLAITASSFA